MDDFNRGDNFGSGYFEVNQRGGWRWNTSKAFLRPVRQRANLQVLTGAYARELLFEGMRCVGLRLLRDDREQTVRAARGGAGRRRGQYAPAAGTVRRG